MLQHPFAQNATDLRRENKAIHLFRPSAKRCVYSPSRFLRHLSGPGLHPGFHLRSKAAPRVISDVLNGATIPWLIFNVNSDSIDKDKVIMYIVNKVNKI